jgi:hypothetical protein
MLSLELFFGIRIINFMGLGVLHPAGTGSPNTPTDTIWLSLLFAIFIILLFGYVYIGGFRAVVVSDIWQCRIMLTTFTTVAAAMLAYSFHHSTALHWERLSRTPPNLGAFYVGITIINLFEPLCISTTWQRFRAFQFEPKDLGKAVLRGTLLMAYMWLLLIGIGIGITLTATTQLKSGDLGLFLSGIVNRGPFFAYMIFPLLIVAGLSGMYSSSDTCVSALMYLSESWSPGDSRGLDREPPKQRYTWIVVSLFTATCAMYAWVSRANYQPVPLAMTLFSNLIFVAPSLVALGSLKPVHGANPHKVRSGFIISSVLLWFLVYWIFDLWPSKDPASGLSLYALLPALIASSVPCALLFIVEKARLNKAHTSEG